MQPKTTAVQTKKHARTEDAGTTDEAAATFEDMCKRAKTTLPKQTSIEPPVVRAHKRFVVTQLIIVIVVTPWLRKEL